MRFRRSFLLRAALVAALVLPVSAAAATGRSSARDAEPIKLGSITILNGPVSVIGLDTVRGAQAEVDYINKHGGALGRKIEFISMDDSNTPQLALQSATKLIQDEHVVGLLGPTNTVSSVAVQKLVEQARIPEVLYQAGGEIATAAKIPYVFRSVPTLDFGYDALVTYYFKTRHYKRVAFIGWNLAGGTSALNGVKVATQQLNGVQLVFSQQLPLTTQDFSGAISQAREAKPDVVIIGGPMPFGGVAAKQIRSSGWDVPIGEFGGFVTSDFGTFLSSAANGIVMTDNAHWKPASKRKVGRAFVAYFRSKYHRPPNANELVGADAVGIMVAGIKKAKSTDGDKIQQTIHKMSYNGIRLNAQWDSSGNLKRFPIPAVVWHADGKRLDLLVDNVFPIIRKKK